MQSSANNQPHESSVQRITTAVCLVAAFFAAPYTSADELLARAQEIHARVITLDTHVDISTDNFTEEVNYLTAPSTQVDLPRMEAGGLTQPFSLSMSGKGR